MSFPVALLSTACDPYTAAASVWIRGLLDDATTTVEVVERRAADLAADPRFRAAIDAALNVERRKAGVEIRRLCHEIGRLHNRINGARETILASRRVGEPGHAAVALGHVLLSLTSARDERQH